MQKAELVTTYTSYKPCPFCGVTPDVEEVGDEWFVSCVNVSCHAYPSTRGEDQIQAIERWNKRHAE